MRLICLFLPESQQGALGMECGCSWRLWLRANTFYPCLSSFQGGWLLWAWYMVPPWIVLTITNKSFAVSLVLSPFFMLSFYVCFGGVCLSPGLVGVGCCFGSLLGPFAWFWHFTVTLRLILFTVSLSSSSSRVCPDFLHNCSLFVPHSYLLLVDSPSFCPVQK